MTDRHGKARVYCYRGRQAKSCGQPSVLLPLIEEQLDAYLATFQLPEETVAEVVRLHGRAEDQRDDAERRRSEIASRIERLAEMYRWGDITREAYRAERGHLEAELVGLRGATDRAAVLAQAAAVPRGLPAAWEAANPEQRTALDWLVLKSVEVADERVVVVVRQPTFAPFFLAWAEMEGLLGENENGAAEATPSSEIMNGRKRRDSNPRSQP